MLAVEVASRIASLSMHVRWEARTDRDDPDIWFDGASTRLVRSPTTALIETEHWATSQATGEVRPRGTTREVIRGTHVAFSPGGASAGTIREDADRARALLCDIAAGLGYFEGWFFGNNSRSLFELLDTAPELQFSPHESVDGHRCVRISGRSSHGLITLWIDAEENVLRKWRQVRTREDLFDGRPLEEPRAGSPGRDDAIWTAETHDLQFEREGGVPTVVRGVIAVTVIPGAERASTVSLTYARSNISIASPAPTGSDDPLLECFDPGQPVIDRRQGGGIRYEVRDGALVPTIDHHLIDGLAHARHQYNRLLAREMIPDELRIAPDRLSSPYCGVACLYFYLSTIDRAPQKFEAVLTPQYVGTEEGSSIAELMALAEDYGVQLAPRSGLDVTQLILLDRPAVLYVRSRLDRPAFNHFLLFLRSSGTEVVVFDPLSASLRTIHAATLGLYWGGEALFLGPHASSADANVAWDALRAHCILFVAVGVAFVPLACVSARSLARRTALLSIFIIGGACLSGAVYHALAPSGLLRRGAATAITAALGQTGFPTITFAEVRQHARGKEVVVVDARPEEQYQRGHIDGALNITPWMSRSVRQSTLAGTAPATLVIVYCGNPECAYSRQVAAALYEDGYANIRIFSGGWDAWLAGARSIASD